MTVSIFLNERVKVRVKPISNTQTSTFTRFVKIEVNSKGYFCKGKIGILKYCIALYRSDVVGCYGINRNNNEEKEVYGQG